MEKYTPRSERSGNFIKKLNTKQIVAAAVITVSLATLGVGAVRAAGNSSATGPMSALVNAIAQKFNLNPTDVQQVVDQTMQAQRTQHEAQEEQQFNTRITQAVTDGKLTQDQANKILAKEQEVKSFIATLNGKTQTERQTAMKTEMDSLKQWATDNNIPVQYLMFGRGMGKGHGHWTPQQ